MAIYCAPGRNRELAQVAYRIGVDVGGSFTHFAVLDDSDQSIRTLKVLSRRDPEAVLQDCGYVSLGRAREDYAVVIVDGAVDVPEIVRLREESLAWQGQHFDHGAARAAFEAPWTRNRYELLTAFLCKTSVPWRHSLKHRVFARVTAQAGDSEFADEQMAAIFDEIKQEYPALGEGGLLR